MVLDKCDETHPLCANCQRLGLECIWADVASRGPTSSTSVDKSPRTQSSHASPTVSIDQPQADVSHHDFGWFRLRPPGTPESLSRWYPQSDTTMDKDEDIPESKERRLLEHRLMQNYLFNLSQPFPVPPGPEWKDLWTRRIPQLALEYDNLLNAVMASSATHLLRSEPDNAHLFAARQRYMVASFRDQRKMVETMTPQSADAVCYAAVIVLVNAFAMLQERELEPYAPPVAWLQMGRGAATVIWMSVQKIMKSGNPEKSDLITISMSFPKLGTDESYFDASFRANFVGILTQQLPSGDHWDDETRDAYERTLSYVGSIQSAIDHGEPTYVICRRLHGFPMVMPPKFIDFVAEKRPRALVILAHYFAMAAQVKGVWWLENDSRGSHTIPQREIGAINSIIPDQWRGQMMWPLEMASLQLRS